MNQSIIDDALERPILQIDVIQRALKNWEDKTFDKVRPDLKRLQLTLGVCEEAGELAHAILKLSQGIRRDENHDAKAKDAIGDVWIFMANLCSHYGWSIEEILRHTAKTVLARTREDQMVRDNG